MIAESLLLIRQQPLIPFQLAQLGDILCHLHHAQVFTLPAAHGGLFDIDKACFHK